MSVNAQSSRFAFHSIASGKLRPFYTEMAAILPSASKQPLCSVGSIGTLQMAPPLRKRERRERGSCSSFNTKVLFRCELRMYRRVQPSGRSAPPTLKRSHTFPSGASSTPFAARIDGGGGQAGPVCSMMAMMMAGVGFCYK